MKSQKNDQVVKKMTNVAEDDKNESEIDSSVLKVLKYLLKSPMQVLFTICGIGALIGIGPFTYFSYKFTVKAIEQKP